MLQTRTGSCLFPSRGFITVYLHNLPNFYSLGLGKDDNTVGNPGQNTPGKNGFAQ